MPSLNGVALPSLLVIVGCDFFAVIQQFDAALRNAKIVIAVVAKLELALFDFGVLDLELRRGRSRNDQHTACEGCPSKP